MVTLAALAALGLATFLASRLARGRRELLAVAVLALPLVLKLPGTLRHEATEVRQNRHVDSSTAEIAAPFLRSGIRSPLRLEEVRFLIAVRRVVPADAEIGFVANPGQRWVRWAAWGLAPRLVVQGADRQWVMLRDQPGDRLGRTVVRVGRFRLVQT
jgi:hypothetical protein